MKFFKREMFIILVVGCFVVVFVSCTNLQNSDFQEMPQESSFLEKDINSPEDNKPDNSEIAMYSMNKKNFQEFLLQPNVEALGRERFSIYRKSGYRDGYIEVVGSSGSVTEEKEGFSRMGSWPVYTEFIDFMSKKENLERILAKNGVQEQLLSYAIIGHEYLVAKENEPRIPGSYPKTCIWLHTDVGDYFLENDSSVGSAYFVDSTYKCYSLEEYSQKYGGS